jgi:hypothetical protein
MLEHVALNQTRFQTPGVAPDSRGIALGKLGVLLFTSIDRLVAFFRVFTDESSLDDLSPKLRIEQVKTSLQSSEFLVFYHATSSYLCDRASRLALMVGGLSFTGSGKHFVQYRDAASPLGYDVRALQPESADYVCYASTFTQSYAKVKELPLHQLVFRLSPLAIPGFSDSASEEVLNDGDVVWLTARRGLGKSVITYLWRNRVDAGATLIELESSSAGQASAFVGAESLFLVRVARLPIRMLRLFLRVPGIVLYRPVGDHAAVQLGYRHPLRLESCSPIFDSARFYLFGGRGHAVEVFAKPTLVPAVDLIGGGFDLDAVDEPHARRPVSPPAVDVPLKLVYVERARRRVTATLVGWPQAEWLKRLVYALPPTMLSSLKVQAIEEGMFIIGERGIDGLPIGDFFQEAAPSIYVPLGYEFAPRVSPEVLTEHLGGVASRAVVFPLGRPAVGLELGAFQPLGRQSLARLRVIPRAADERLPAARSVTPATVINEDAGVLPLWGFRADPSG